MHERILIVDDDDCVRESLMDELSDDYKVDAAASGEEAEEYLQSHLYDAVISDLRMPGKNGIDVLESARAKDPDVVRILLTGYLDEHARTATRQPDAPFKIGKPWHDEVQVTLKRAFEHRARERELSSSVTDALTLADIDTHLSCAEGVQDIATVVTDRVALVRGVRGCEVAIGGFTAAARVLASHGELSGEWHFERDLDEDGDVRATVAGDGSITRDIAEFIVERARRFAGQDFATRLARKAVDDDSARHELVTVTRRATMGAMTASLMHEVASIVQCMQGALHQLDDVARPRLVDCVEALECLDEANATADRVVALFRAMRSFVRSEGSDHREYVIADLIAPATALAGAYVRGRARLCVGALPDVRVTVSKPLFLQVLVNLLRNAADASPPRGTVDLDVQVGCDTVRLCVTDDGDGVPEQITASLFEPFVTTKDDGLGSGLGLAISATIVREHGGSIHYERASGRGARFVVTLPMTTGTRREG